MSTASKDAIRGAQIVALKYLSSIPASSKSAVSDKNEKPSVACTEAVRGAQKTVLRSLSGCTPKS